MEHTQTQTQKAVDSHIFKGVCKYCLRERGMAEHDYKLDSGEIVTIYQCLHCKMIQPQEA